MNRRGFFKLVGAAVVGLSLALSAPKERYSARWLRFWDPVKSRMVTRVDIFRGEHMPLEIPKAIFPGNGYIVTGVQWHEIPRAEIGTVWNV